jgi:transposase
LWISLHARGGGVLAKPLVADELWEILQPLLPPPKPRRFRYPGRKPIDDRKVLTGILFVLKTGIPGEDLPVAMGYGSGMTCWRRLHAWPEAGVWWERVQVLRTRLDDAGLIDWSRAAVDSTFARACGGGAGSGNNPTDRGRPGVKQHVWVDAPGIPLAAETTAAHTPESKELLLVVDSAGPLDEATGQGQHRPAEVYGDRA